MRPMLTFLAFLPLIAAFDCSLTASSISYDISPLTGLRTASKDSSTPPTTSEAKVSMNLCAAEGLGKEDDVADEDQCPENTRVCLKLVNHKPSSSEPDRVTAVVPFWLVDTPDSDITTTPLGKNGEQGLKITVKGQEYAGLRQSVNLTLLCDTSSDSPNPTLVSYTAGALSLEWATPDACPRSGDSSSPSSSDGGGGGFVSFVKTLFWLIIIGLILYFAIGIFYNHQQYSARGWDLIPHRDFWREVPTLVQDLVSHVMANVRGSGSGGRGGYSSLG
ncbi:hypothetical protein I314_04788 [Cryptococcus bacillisporus CA1873]|uniref:Autophagy-related protein 27 n=1 Tax=Cryptococcus bacillisporus CA1873 TaxID=1296111 RepID=A0ABR5B6R7_CRYGA|nr:hypothetical protein I314_04788 [Cryptococcus bacillisporus CA1873]|eukprot:KIR59273.1 hypothetical protein I314_04788 [Cryptococcus gattii CA1873]